MQVRLLGPVEVSAGGTVRPVPGLRRKAVLAVLALHAREIVSTDRLIDVVWGGKAPATAPNTLQSHVSYLRRLLGVRAAIVARPPGYLLDLGDEATDVEVAERLIRPARPSADPAQTASQLRTALALWRGRPLVDVAGVAWLEEQAERLEQLRLEATRGLIDARLGLGESAPLLPELEELTQRYPFHERFHGQRMLALYRTGRQADALAAYQRLRRTLGEELGIDPSPALRDLQAAILRQDETLDSPASPMPAVPTPGPGSVPAQLPLAVPGFAGRAAELAQLDAIVARLAGAGTGQATVLISVVSGTAGVGKTSLAVHWAHRVRDHFPDGQLYVNLRGFAPDGSAMDASEAVRDILEALGVTAERIPSGLDAQTALYRSVLAGRRVLLLLDNARDVEQVRPLLAGGAGSLVIVTSRDQLTSLVAAEAAHPLTLGLLSETEARDLLVSRIGADRVAAEPEAVEEIVTRSARLPLALAIVGARAATQPDFPLAKLAVELHDAGRTLDGFGMGSTATDVRAVFSWSYRTLDHDAARLFRLLGRHPGPDFAVPAAASVAGEPVWTVRTSLASLARAHLLAEHAPGRYGCHDLLRAYAIELADVEDPEADRQAAAGRVFDHYLHTAYEANRRLFPHRDPISVAPARHGVTGPEIGSAEAALSWFESEYTVLMAAIDEAPGYGLDVHAWKLVWSLATFLDRRGRWHELVATHRAALAAAYRLGDREAEAYVVRCLGIVYCELNDLDQAERYCRRAIDLANAMGDHINQAQVNLNLARVSDRRGRPAAALHHSRQALALYQAIGHQVGEARALNNIGWCHAQLGDYEQALAPCRQALSVHQELGDPEGEAVAWDSLGFAYHHLGDHTEAIGCYRRTLELYRETGDRVREAETHTFLGDTYQDAGDPDSAREHWRRAVDIYDQLASPAAEQVLAKLAGGPAA